jgi:hypothetical protein
MGSSNGGRVMIASVVVVGAEVPREYGNDATFYLPEHDRACLPSDQCLS